MPKSEPITVRLPAELDQWVTAEAKRTRRPKGTVVEALASEALKARRFPGIAFRGDDWDRRAWMMGTSFDVWQIVRAYQDVRSIDGIVRRGILTLSQVRLALAYYKVNSEEIDAFIDRDRRNIDELRATYPNIEVVEV
jgi:uncharacterized protein (DUF433 family)